MEGFHFPPFLVDRFNRRQATVEVAASQIQESGAAVFVRKDLPGHEDWKIQALDPSGYGLLS